MNRLKYLRTEKGENLEKVAEYLNVSIQTISNYENEKRDMTPDTIIKLAKYFGVSTDYLLGKSDIRNPENTDLDKLQIGLSTKDYSNISDDQIKQIEDFAKFVLKDNKKEDKEKNENNKG